MTAIEIAAQALFEKKAEFEALFVEIQRVKNDELVRNKNLLEATTAEIGRAQKKRHEMIVSGASPFNKSVKIERDKEIEASAVRDDLTLAILSDEIKVGEMELQLSELKKIFLVAKGKYLDEVAEKCLNDFIENPDTKIIQAAHLLAAKELADPFSVYAQANILNSRIYGVDYEAMVAEKIALLFMPGGKFKEFITKSAAREFLAEHEQAISTSARAGDMSLGKEKSLRNELEAKKKALPVW